MTKYFQGSTLVNVIKGIVGIAIATYAIVSEDYIFLIVGMMFILHGMSNYSCWNIFGCESDNSTNNEAYAETTNK